jgi:hypothetical protein
MRARKWFEEFDRDRSGRLDFFETRMAIRAARMDALRDLTEQVHGIRINATTTIREAVVKDDSLSAVVQGTLRGARTTRVGPSGSDSYEVEMVLDRETVAYIVRALKGRV